MIPPEKCFWNRKYKGYRQKWLCVELEIAASLAIINVGPLEKHAPTPGGPGRWITDGLEITFLLCNYLLLNDAITTTRYVE